MEAITKRIALEIIEHEAIVRSAYLDSVNVWTWSVGVTNRSGHTVHPRYKDNPQSLAYCLEVFEWVLRTNFLPNVLEEFKGHDLEEHELGGALSFHWNTGSINQASWTDAWKAGDMADAERRFMLWKKPPEIIPRRKKEADLLFRGIWTSDGKVTEFPVKSNYRPDFGNGFEVDVDAILDDLFGEKAEPEPNVTITISREAALELQGALADV